VNNQAQDRPGEVRGTRSMSAPEAGIYRDDAAFFKRARRGEWREILDNEQDLRRYDHRVAGLVPPDLSTWMHRS
jgi:hypothetical protein